MFKITRAVRAGVREALELSDVWDASTMRISRDGSVHAKPSRDKDKGRNWKQVRFYLYPVSAIVRPDGAIREGWRGSAERV
jgi:hypothetical protein